MKPVTFRAVIPGEKSGNSKQICQCNRFHYLLANSKSQVQINIRERQKGAELRKVMLSDAHFGFNVMERLCLLLRERIQSAYGAMEKM